MSWLSLAFVLAIASSSVYCGTVSKLMRDFRKPIKHLYLDFDETISTDALSKYVRNIYCKQAGMEKDWELVGAGSCRNPGGSYKLAFELTVLDTEEECKAKCKADPNCGAVEFSRAGNCYGFIESGKQGFHIGVKSNELKCWQKFKDRLSMIGEGKCLNDNGKRPTDIVYRPGKKANSEKECQRRCENNPKCQSVEYNYEPGGLGKSGKRYCNIFKTTSTKVQEVKTKSKIGFFKVKKSVSKCWSRRAKAPAVKSPPSECNTETMPKDKMAMVDALRSEKENGRPNVTVSMTGNGKDGYRKDERIQAMANFINDVRTLLDGNVFIVSTSWYPVNEEQWQAYLKYISDETGLGFPLDHIFAVEDPGPGLSADKGAVIKANMAKHGIMFDEALFADDSAGNIKSAQGVCNTLHLSKRAGLDDTDRDYITHVASLPEFRPRRSKEAERAMKHTLQREGERKFNKHERKGKHNKAARGPPAPPGGHYV